MDYTNLLVELKDQILFITINRETKLNALNRETLEEIHSALQEALSDPAVRGIIFTGAGGKAFVAGADISEFSNYDQEQGRLLALEGQKKVFDLIDHFPKPVIAAINGFALGGGLELAMACHFRFASDNARMGLPEVSLGLIPGYGGTQRLAQLIGKGRALELILTGEMTTAAEAYRIGLINHITEPSELISKAELSMRTILKRSPNAVGAAIRAINAGFENKEAYTSEIEEFSKCFGSADFREGVDAFLSKRQPNF